MNATAGDKRKKFILSLHQRMSSIALKTLNLCSKMNPADDLK